eukprot:TRINITY_DN25720_c0_g1_i1.p1 TRINITY_DN25720_c0_g1~~TRINITY_DN25720_c0_g1_i1.p1  ORF type:complete len:102 (-),score=10.30 TRINITY_DN25720_c0_g1_i1:21-326(-)
MCATNNKKKKKKKKGGGEINIRDEGDQCWWRKCLQQFSYRVLIMCGLLVAVRRANSNNTSFFITLCYPTTLKSEDIRQLLFAPARANHQVASTLLVKAIVR